MPMMPIKWSVHVLHLVSMVKFTTLMLRLWFVKQCNIGANHKFIANELAIVNYEQRRRNSHWRPLVERGHS